MYLSSFFDLFLVLIVITVWSRYLMTYPEAPRSVRWLPWIAGTALVGGQIMATMTLAGPPSASGGLAPAWWVSNAGIGLSAVALLLSSGSVLLRRRARDPQ